MRAVQQSAKRILNSRTARQTALLFGAQVLNVLFGIIISAANTRLLTVEEFGIFSFVTATILFISLFFDFGVFTSGSRLVALAPGRREERECIGALFVLTLIVGGGLSLLILVTSFFIDAFFPTKIGGLLLMLSPFVAVFPFQTLLVFIFRGNNQIRKLAMYTFLPRVVYLAAILVVWRFFAFNLVVSLYLYVLTLVVATSIVMVALKPSLRDLKTRIRMVLKETREYGLNVYVGALADVFTRGTDKLLISYFVGAIPVGYYSIASMLTSPISMVSVSLAASVFKDLTVKEKISHKMIAANFGVLFASGIGLILLGKPIITYVFSEKYLAALPIIPVLTLSAFFNGMSQLYNVFFAAHRMGSYLRNTSIVTSSCNVIGNIILVGKLGMLGAALASVLTFFLTYVMNLYYYRKGTSSVAVSTA